MCHNSEFAKLQQIDGFWKKRCTVAKWETNCAGCLLTWISKAEPTDCQHIGTFIRTSKHWNICYALATIISYSSCGCVRQCLPPTHTAGIPTVGKPTSPVGNTARSRPVLPVTKNLSWNQAKRQTKLLETNRNNHKEIITKTKWPWMAHIEKKTLSFSYKVHKARTTFMGRLRTGGALKFKGWFKTYRN